MRSGHSSRCADESNLLTTFDRVANGDFRFAHMEVAGHETVTVIDTEPPRGRWTRTSTRRRWSNAWWLMWIAQEETKRVNRARRAFDANARNDRIRHADRNRAEGKEAVVRRGPKV